ncbi:hypothetical protein DAPPUDRAFT_187647 [Daphnia pulex]|uniref:Ketoreductase domain-containing protein n=1 Tax=Daphnia pulex TaxID=6669 RepID=E9G4Z5_DAPPU|nr:hypothetical protein DAPPUDRAFT_187647 [Daphnia pulex]|eukprot:EFX85472.1 hypothetical protein DAPPUDRAFT_187647 [Daphnia pulex]
MDFFTFLFIISVLIVVLLLILIFFSDGDLTLMFLEKIGTRLSSARGKVYWVVGASSGIGKELAFQLAAHGAKLVISARRETELKAVKAGCLAIGKNAGLVESDVLILPFDVTKVDSHKHYFDLVIRHFGTLDVLINNSGRSQKAEFQNIKLKVDKELFKTNVFGLVNLTRVVLPHFLAKSKGHIVVTSSCAGKFGAPLSSSYNATKHALHGYFETARSELAPKGISITMICPGMVHSDILTACATENPGEQLGGKIGADEKRMKTERCAKLCAVAIVNKLDEVWISLNPVLFFLYVSQYAPTIARAFLSRYGVQAAIKTRGRREAGALGAR